MVAVRTTMRPFETIEVSETELRDLQVQGLIYTDWNTLWVNFYMYIAGPLATVSNVQIRIQTSPGGTDVIATTSTGVLNQDIGTYFYRWLEGAQPGPGDYTVTWTATDGQGNPVTATETVTIEEEV